MTQHDIDQPKRPSGMSIAALVAAPLLLVAGLWFVLGERGAPGTVATGERALIGANVAEFTPDQRRGIETIIKDYLIQHPEILVEVQTALEGKMAKEEAERTKAMVADHAKEIFRAPDAPVAGNPDGDITVVEFFDYNCGYCKRGFADIARLVESDKNVRVVFKEFPILRDESEEAARVALAAGMQGKYWEVHRDMIVTKGLVNEAVGLKIAEKHGLDLEKLKTDMTSSRVDDELNRVKALASKLSINGTPHFLIGDRAIGGAPENLLEVIETHVADLRKTGCSYC